MTATPTAIHNRLQKNWGQLKPWADRLGIEAFRLYDRDIPEYPSIIEVYGSRAILWDRRDDEIDRGKERQFKETLDAAEALGFGADKLVVKRRERQRPRAAGDGIGSGSVEGGISSGGRQYERQNLSFSGRGDNKMNEFEIREGAVKLLVNLQDYLDTGLFLDHRLTRKKIADHIEGRTQKRQRTRMLNLFCYTGSVSVYAAKAGATVTSVDMSPTYLAWAERNFIANGLMTSNHRFINDDVLAWAKAGLAIKTGPYEMIFCDPPTFSNSKKMDGTWEIQRDHRWLIERCLEALTPDGILIFSANRRDFHLDDALTALPGHRVKEISRETLPKDFHDPKIRRVFQFS